MYRLKYVMKINEKITLNEMIPICSVGAHKQLKGYFLCITQFGEKFTISSGVAQNWNTTTLAHFSR
jgi:hypothetical protein